MVFKGKEGNLRGMEEGNREFKGEWRMEGGKERVRGRDQKRWVGVPVKVGSQREGI